MNDELKNQIEAAVGPLDGWTTPERGLKMAELVLKVRPRLVVELGVFGGKSLIPQAMAVRHNDMGVVVGIDPWKVEPALEGENDANREWWSKSVNLEEIHRKTMGAIWQHHLDRWAVIIRATSQDAAPVIGEIDILNIDGNHSEVASCRDVSNYLPKVRAGGFVWMDDADWNSTKPAQKMMDEHCDLIEDAGHWRLYQKKSNE